MVVITADHGRDAVSGKDHGGQTERERTIWIATNRASLNLRFGDKTAIVDILPSIAEHTGFDVPPKVREALDGASFIDYAVDLSRVARDFGRPVVYYQLGFAKRPFRVCAE